MIFIGAAFSYIERYLSLASARHAAPTGMPAAGSRLSTLVLTSGMPKTLRAQGLKCAWLFGFFQIRIMI
jgi:hypothetical protein